jgi:hypothetical protein
MAENEEEKAEPVIELPAPTRSRKGKKAKKATKAKKAPAKARKPRTVRSFPASTFEEALVLPSAIQQFASGQKVRRLTLFDHLGKSPDSGPSRQLVINAGKYGLVSGGYQGEYLELTPDGNVATSQEGTPTEQLTARFRLAVEKVSPFKTLYDRFKGSKLPTQAVLRDTLLEAQFDESEVAEAVDTFVLNAKFLGLLRPVAGAERLLPVEHLLEEFEKAPGSAPAAVLPQPSLPGVPLAPLAPKQKASTASSESWEDVCFYITPIGEPDSDQRQHSDLFLSSIVEPALQEFNLRLVRADQISQAGMITRQVLEHIVYARLVIADLSFHNPNVFYELSFRHACRKPTVQLIRESERIPFDLEQYRTIKIDTTSIYTLVPQLETYRSEIANQVRRALADPDAVDNPLSVFFPNLKTSV